MIRVAVLISLCATSTQASELATLFTTQVQRHELDNHQLNPVIDTPILVAEPVQPINDTKAQFNGFVTIDGKTTTWINGTMNSGQSTMNGEILLNQNNRTIRLRPGQFFDPANLHVKEGFARD